MEYIEMQKFDLKRLCKDCGIRLVPFRSVTDLMKKAGVDLLNVKGYAFMIDGDPMILFDDKLPEKEIRYTIAHELGHILLGHLSYRMNDGKLPPHAEMEANIFASVLFGFDLLAEYGPIAR